LNIPLNIDWQQILLHLLNFLLLVAGLYLILYKPVKDFMEKRTQHYVQMDQQAKENLDHAAQLKASYQENLDHVKEEISQKRALAAQESQQTAATLLKNTKKQAAKLISDAQAAAKQERAKIVEGAQQEIALMAISATEKLLAPSASDSLDQFLDAVERESARDGA
jgi:F-type H+-transporting ATPase subunit b